MQRYEPAFPGSCAAPEYQAIASCYQVLVISKSYISVYCTDRNLLQDTRRSNHKMTIVLKHHLRSKILHLHPPNALLFNPSRTNHAMTQLDIPIQIVLARQTAEILQYLRSL